MTVMSTCMVVTSCWWWGFILLKTWIGSNQFSNRFNFGIFCNQFPFSLERKIHLRKKIKNKKKMALREVGFCGVLFPIWVMVMLPRPRQYGVVVQQVLNLFLTLRGQVVRTREFSQLKKGASSNFSAFAHLEGSKFAGFAKWLVSMMI